MYFLGQSLHLYFAVTYRVLPLVGGNYSTYFIGRPTFRKICVIYNDTGYIQVSKNFSRKYFKKNLITQKRLLLEFKSN